MLLVFGSYKDASVAAAAIKKYEIKFLYCGFFYCSDHLRIWLESIAAIEKASIQKFNFIFFYWAFSIAAVIKSKRRTNILITAAIDERRRRRNTTTAAAPQ